MEAQARGYAVGGLPLRPLPGSAGAPFFGRAGRSAGDEQPLPPLRGRGRHFFDLDTLFNQEALSPWEEDLKAVRGLFGAALARAVAFLYHARLLHDQLEAFYTSQMGFARLELFQRQTLEKLCALGGK